MLTRVINTTRDQTARHNNTVSDACRAIDEALQKLQDSDDNCITTDITICRLLIRARNLLTPDQRDSLTRLTEPTRYFPSHDGYSPIEPLQHLLQQCADQLRGKPLPAAQQTRQKIEQFMTYYETEVTQGGHDDAATQDGGMAYNFQNEVTQLIDTAVSTMSTSMDTAMASLESAANILSRNQIPHPYLYLSQHFAGVLQQNAQQTPQPHLLVYLNFLCMSYDKHCQQATCAKHKDAIGQGILHAHTVLTTMSHMTSTNAVNEAKQKFTAWQENLLSLSLSLPLY